MKQCGLYKKGENVKKKDWRNLQELNLQAYWCTSIPRNIFHNYLRLACVQSEF